MPQICTEPGVESEAAIHMAYGSPVKSLGLLHWEFHKFARLNGFKVHDISH